MKQKGRIYLGTLVILGAALLIYMLLTDVFGLLNPLVFPEVSRIASSLVNSMPQLLDGLVSSMGLLIPAYFSAAFIGITLGIVVGLQPTLNKMIKPIIFALNPIPPTMLTPYLIIIMPTFYFSSVALIFIGCFWPFLNGTINGIILIEQKYLEKAKVLELRGFKKLFRVVLPAALPFILAGAGTALNLAFILLVIAETFATTSGLGFFIQFNADFFNYANVVAGLIFTSSVIIVIMLAFDRFKRRLLFWMLSEAQK
jgi:NitT/TauT family transport system permease protein